MHTDHRTFTSFEPPEVLEIGTGDEASIELRPSPASDVYSFSLILLLVCSPSSIRSVSADDRCIQLVTGKEAYSQENLRIWVKVGRITDRSNPLRPVPEKYPLLDQSHAFCWPLMQACWKPNPDDRITSREARHWLRTRSPPSAVFS